MIGSSDRVRKVNIAITAEGDGEDKDLGEKEVADADGDAVGEIVEPMVNEPP